MGPDRDWQEIELIKLIIECVQLVSAGKQRLAANTTGGFFVWQSISSVSDWSSSFREEARSSASADKQRNRVFFITKKGLWRHSNI